MAIAPIGRFCTTSGMHTIGCARSSERCVSQQVGLVRRDRLAEHALAERRLRERRELHALGGDRLRAPILARRSRRRANTSAPIRLITISVMIRSTSCEIERGVELVARDVEVGEVVVLLLDLDVALRELRVLVLDLVEPLAHVVHSSSRLAMRVDQLLAQLLPVARVCAPPSPGGRRPSASWRAQPLVLLQQLAGELRALAEQGEELLRARAELDRARSCAPLHDATPPPSTWLRSRPTPRWIAGAISSSGSTAIHRAGCGSPAAACRRSPPSPPTPRSRCRPTRCIACAPRRPSSPMPVSTTRDELRAVVLRRRLEQPVDRRRVAVAAGSRHEPRHDRPARARLELEVAAARREQDRARLERLAAARLARAERA